MPASAWAWTDGNIPITCARENGAEAAMRFMADADSIPGERVGRLPDLQRPSASTAPPIATRSSYFLRGAGRQSFGQRLCRHRLSIAESVINRHGMSKLAAIKANFEAGYSRLGQPGGNAVSAILDLQARHGPACCRSTAAELDPRLIRAMTADDLMTAKATLRGRCAVLACVRRVSYIDYTGVRGCPARSQHQSSATSKARSMR